MLTLCERGHDVTLYEASNRLGGHVIPGSVLPFKQDMRDYRDYLLRQAKKAPARILLNTQATKEMLGAESYDALIVAVGSKPIVPSLPGIGKPHVHWAPDADSGELPVGANTVVVGAGAVGVETAIGLKRRGRDVTIVEMLPDMSHLRTSSGAAAMELMATLTELGIPIRLNCKLDEVADRSILCRDMKSGERIELPADTVLLALGVSARQDEADALRRALPKRRSSSSAMRRKLELSPRQ